MKESVMHEKLGGTPEGRALLGVIEAANGVGGLAEILDVSHQTVTNWVYLLRRVSRQGAIDIERTMGVNREDLRPDIKDWNAPERNYNLVDSLGDTPRGKGLLMVLERVKNSRKALSAMLGLSSPRIIQKWISHGYVPKRHVKKLLAMPEFEGLTAEMIRPDLHELEY